MKIIYYRDPDKLWHADIISSRGVPVWSLAWGHKSRESMLQAMEKLWDSSTYPVHEVDYETKR